VRRSVTAAGVAAFALACGCAEPSPTAQIPCPEPDPVVDWDAPTLEPEIALEDLDRVVVRTMEDGVVHPAALRRWFLDLLARMSDPGAIGDPACPVPLATDPDTTEADANNWSGTCRRGDLTIEGGWVTTFGHIPGDRGRDLQWTWLILSFTGRYDDGRTLHAGGRVTTITGTDATDESFYLEAAGSFLDEGAEGPLAAGVSAGEVWRGGYGPRTGLRGEFTGPIGSGDAQLNLPSLVLDPACGEAPRGTLQVRDPSSGWWTVALADDCSGCGAVYWGEERRGETCVGSAVRQALDASFAREWGVR
jgi:hypothetical protein